MSFYNEHKNPIFIALTIFFAALSIVLIITAMALSSLIPLWIMPITASLAVLCGTIAD